MKPSDTLTAPSLSCCRRADGGHLLLAGLVTLLAVVGVPAANAQEAQPRTNLQEPVYRVSNAKTKIDPRNKAESDAHPLDPALAMAYGGLKTIRESIDDYTCTLVKRERIKGKLNDYNYMFVKVRNRKVVDGRVVVPFSVYLHFLKPDRFKGREAVFVEGKNNNKLCAHEGGTRGRFLPTVWLKPESDFAMQGQLYPLTDIGIEKLVVKLIERGTRERKFPDCKVSFHKNAKVNGRTCTLLLVEHPNHRPEYEFRRAEIFIDDEYNVPIRYAAYGWPSEPGGQLPLLEEFTYLNLKLNVGLTDEDFDPKNPKYNF